MTLKFFLVGLGSAIVSACGPAGEWIREDPRKPEPPSSGPSGREIVASLGTADTAAKPEKKRRDGEAEESAPTRPPTANKPAEPRTTAEAIDRSQLDLSGEFPIARPVEGRDGFVLSPYDGRIIDVRGIASGSLAADPRHPLEERKYFRVP